MVAFYELWDLIWPYVRRRIGAQIRSVAFIVTYLIFFQTVILRIPILEAGIIAGGMALVVIGLAFFIEGLVLGLMPLGESIGVKLPSRASFTSILVFAFILGVGATFAEPAIGILRAAGSKVTQSDAPLLFLLLNQKALFQRSSTTTSRGNIIPTV